MYSPCLALALASIWSCYVCQLVLAADIIKYGRPLDGFISYSLEFSSFPDYAGNNSHPNNFSYNLLNNIADLQGTKPYIRVGGNTQDYAVFNSSLKTALVGTFDSSRSADYPTTIVIGPSFFESYNTWPGIQFSHGFNLGGNHDYRVFDTLLQTIPLACKALQGRMYTLEYGNEADAYPTSAQGQVRPLSYTEANYVEEWHEGTQTIRKIIRDVCPDARSRNGAVGFMAPSFTGVNNRLSARKAWEAGLNSFRDIHYFSSHFYITGANMSGVTLQDTLMNHNVTMRHVEAHVAEWSAIGPGIPYIFGEANSLYNQGRPGLSNTFGAALWAIDFCLYSASVGIGRIHLHMGTNYRYQSWQPIATEHTTIGTKAPYYGNIAVAAFLGDQRATNIQIAHFPLKGTGHEAAYGSYTSRELRKIMVINMNAYNYSVADPSPRGYRVFALPVSAELNIRAVTLHRLVANGSDAITGITWDGWSYNYELAEGKPVRLPNVTIGEKLQVQNGLVNVPVWDSEAVIVNLEK